MNGLPKTVKEIAKHFPRKIPAEHSRQVEAEMRWNFLFCYDKEDRQRAGCTCCKKEVIIPATELHRYTHKSIAQCPKCGRQVEVKHLWRYKQGITGLHQPVLSYHYTKSVLDPEIITCMAVYTNYHCYSNTPWKDKPFQVVDGYYLFKPEVGAVYAAPRYAKSSYWICRGNQYYFSTDFELYSKVTERERIYNTGMSVATGIDVWRPNEFDIEKLLAGTSLKYVWQAYARELRRYGERIGHIKLLEYMCRYPLQMEYLAKVGFGDVIIDGLMDGMLPGSVFYLRGKTLDSITRGRMSKQDKSFVHNIEAEGRNSLDIHDLQRWQKVRRIPGCEEIPLQKLIIDKSLQYARTDSFSCLRYVRLEKLKRYLAKQHDKYPDYKHDIDLYADYIHNCETLGADMASKSTLWPKNLMQEHANQKVKVKIFKAKEKEQTWQKRKTALIKKYRFKRDGFEIVVPDKLTDLILEGEQMHNCVGTYVERVVKAETDVVFIRLTEAREQSYGTMEIRDGRIVQARGKFNKDLPTEGKAFVELFRMEVLQKGA